MDQLSKAFGVDFWVFESYVKNGKRMYVKADGTEAPAPNGFYDENGIHIDLNAGKDGRGVMLYTLGHELTHHIRKNSPEKFKAFADVVMQGYGRRNISAEGLIQEQISKAKKNGREIDYDTAYEEMIADSMEGILADGKVLEKLKAIQESDPSLWETVKQWAKDTAGKIRKIVDAYKGQRMDSAEGKIVANMKEILPQLEELYAEGLADTRGSVVTDGDAGAKNAAKDGGVKYQARSNGSFDDSEIAAIQSIGRKSINSFTSSDIQKTEAFAKRYWQEMGVKSPFFRAWFGDWRVNDQTPVQIADRPGSTRGIQHNDDTGWDIQVSGQVFNETKNHRDSYNIAARPYLPYINDIVSKSILLDSFGIDIGKAKSNNSLLMHNLYAVADIGNGQEVLKLYVEEMNDPNSADTRKRAYQLQNIEKYRPTGKGSQNSASPLSPVVGNIHTVADLFAYVKNMDSSFSPNDSSSVTNNDGSPKVVYHGTNTEFWVFDLNSSGSNYGETSEGLFFFTNKKSGYQDSASDYAKNASKKGGNERIVEAYLDIKKPMMLDSKGYFTPTEYFDKNADDIYLKYLEGDYDGIIIENSNKSDDDSAIYLLDDPAKIKSATDNIGTFDSQNPDIRYSDRDPDAGKMNQLLQKQNAELRDTVDYLKELVKLQGRTTNGTVYTRGSIEAAGRKLMRMAGAKGDVTELSGILSECYSSMAEGSEDMVSNAKKAAQWLVEHKSAAGEDAGLDAASVNEQMMNVYESFTGLIPIRTVADKYQGKIDALKGKYNRQIQDIRSKYSQELEDLKKKRAEDIREVRQQMQEKSEARQKAVMEDFAMQKSDLQAAREDTRIIEREFIRLAREYEKAEYDLNLELKFV